MNNEEKKELQPQSEVGNDSLTELVAEESNVNAVDPIWNIAKACHEVNRAYCEGHGDTSQVPWAEAPDNIKRSAYDGVKYLLDNPGSNASALHDNWCAFKVEDGWSYGKVKDAKKKTHPCLVTYGELPPKQRLKDKLFSMIVKSF